MCTLTIFRDESRRVVTMNRDESRSRTESNRLHFSDYPGFSLAYPVDLRGGGTWFGVSSHNLILCILNRYHASRPDDPRARTRGTIIKSALEQGTSSRVARWLERLDCREFNPFDLFLITREEVLHYAWNSETFTGQPVNFSNWYMFTSSSLNTEVLAYRQNLFDTWKDRLEQTRVDTDEILRGFHLVQTPGKEAYSVLADRPHSHTKSVIQAAANSDHLLLKYIPDVQQRQVDEALANALTERINTSMPSSI